jgi:hypothetical protein
MKKAPIQVYLDVQDRQLLDGLMARHGMSIADAVRTAIRRWAIEETQMDDPVLGLIGTMEATDLPADLSTRHDEYAVYGHAPGAVRRIAERRSPSE